MVYCCLRLGLGVAVLVVGGWWVSGTYINAVLKVGSSNSVYKNSIKCGRCPGGRWEEVG
jgi:hypothetical protein